MLGCSNHVAGVLLRIDHAVKTGATKPSSTSELCKWNTPNAKTIIKPTKVSDVAWTKSHYSKHDTSQMSANGSDADKNRILIHYVCNAHFHWL